MEITVAGRATASLPPERATVHLTVAFEGPEPQGVLQRTSHVVNQVTAHLDQLKAVDPSPTTWSSVQPIRTRTWRPYSDKGKVTALVYTAACSIQVKFSDIGALSAFVDGWGGSDGVTIGAVHWALTDQTRTAQEGKVLREAVANARDRATTIADAAGGSQVYVLEVADPGLLGGQRAGTSSAPYAASTRAGAPGAPSGAGPIEVTPQDIDVHAVVHVRFATDS